MSQRSGWSATVFMLGAATANAQVPSRPQPPPRPPLTVAVTSWTTRASDQAHARHVSSVFDSWQLRVDSAVNGTLFARQPIAVGVRYYTDGQLRIPIVRGQMQRPQVIAVPSRLRENMFDRTGILPLPIAERASRLVAIREFITYAAVFDGVLDSVSTIEVVERDSAGVALRLTATRFPRVLGDSVLNSRPVRVLRDSTVIALEQSLPISSRFSSAVGGDVQSLRGTIVGRRVVDLGTQRTVAMHDTLLLTGRVRVDDGYGGVSDLPHYEYSVRDVTVRDSLSAPEVREPFDMVRTRTPRTPQTGAERDAAIARLLTASTIRARDSIRAQFRFPRDSTYARRIIAHALTIGDSAAAAQWMIQDAYDAQTRLTPSDWRVLRGWLRDAAAARRVGVDRELIAISLVDALTHAPPVLASAAQPAVCAPTVCRAMATDVAERSQPLRAVALVAAMVTSPRGWTDSVIANAARNPLLETRALWFARGTSTTAGASAKAPIPEPDANSQVWWFWLRGQDSAYTRSRSATAVAPLRARGSIANYSNDIAARSIRFAAVRTGHDYAAALRRHRLSADDDSSRALFGMLLLAIGDSLFTASELRSLALAAPSDERLLAMQQIARMPTVLAADSVAADIGIHLLESLYGSRPLVFVGDTAQRRGFFDAPTLPDSITRYLTLDSLPDAVRQRATALGHAPVPRGWTFPDGTTGFITRVGPVRRMGSFYAIDVSYTTLYARGPSRSGGYANGYTLWLIDGPRGWIVFSAQSWVT